MLFSLLLCYCSHHGVPIDRHRSANSEPLSRKPGINPWAFNLLTAKLLAFSQDLCMAPITSAQEKSPLEGTTSKQCGHKPVRAVWSQGPYYLAIQVVILKF